MLRAVLCLRRFPLLVQRALCLLWRAFAGLCSTCDVPLVGAGGSLLALVPVRWLWLCLRRFSLLVLSALFPVPN